MDFLSKMGEAISNVGKDVTEKAKEITDVTKLNMELKSKEDFIRRQYESIGKKIYQAQKEDESSPFEEIFAIKQTFAEIEDVKKEIAQKKGLKSCTSCGKEFDPKAAFCPNCGQKAEEEEEIFEADEVIVEEVVEED